MGRHTSSVVVKFKHASEKLNALIDRLNTIRDDDPIFSSVGTSVENGWEFIFDAAEDYKDKNKNDILCDVATKEKMKVFIVNEAPYDGKYCYCVFANNKDVLLKFMKDFKLGVKITSNDIVQQTI